MYASTPEPLSAFFMSSRRAERLAAACAACVAVISVSTDAALAEIPLWLLFLAIFLALQSLDCTCVPIIIRHVICASPEAMIFECFAATDQPFEKQTRSIYADQGVRDDWNFARVLHGCASPAKAIPKLWCVFKDKAYLM